MSLQAWPRYAFPDPNIDAYSGNDMSAVVRTGMDSGRYRQRQRFTRSVKNYKLTWKLNPSQFWAFQNYIDSMVSGGADSFTMDLWMGNGPVNVTARFVVNNTGPYNFTFTDPHYIVTALIEVSDFVPLTAAQTALLLLEISLDVSPSSDYVQNSMSNYAQYAGDLQLNDTFGVLAIVVPCSIQSFCYAFGTAPTGANAQVELQDASNNVIATFTLTAGVQRAQQLPDGGLPIALSVGTLYHWKITAIGSSAPGSLLSICPLLY